MDGDDGSGDRLNSLRNNPNVANSPVHSPNNRAYLENSRASTSGGGSGFNGGADNSHFYSATGSSNDPLHLDTLLQGIDWMDSKGDDLLGWMDNIDFNV